VQAVFPSVPQEYLFSTFDTDVRPIAGPQSCLLLPLLWLLFTLFLFALLPCVLWRVLVSCTWQVLRTFTPCSELPPFNRVNLYLRSLKPVSFAYRDFIIARAADGDGEDSAEADNPWHKPSAKAAKTGVSLLCL
jgi:hypothetical protein